MDVLENLQKLPEMCAQMHSYNSTVIIKRSVMGYFPAPALMEHPGSTAQSGLTTAEKIQAFNEAHGATKRHVATMEAGSIFGWEIPAADMNTYDEDRRPIPAKVRRQKAACPRRTPQNL